jgi:hypothetical protein
LSCSEERRAVENKKAGFAPAFLFVVPGVPVTVEKRQPEKFLLAESAGRR